MTHAVHTAAPFAEFDRLFNGTLYSLMSWAQLESFWSRINPDDGWYIYAVGETCPVTPATAEHVRTFIAHIDELLRREHQEDYCGIVYADDLNTPRIIKIYDPNNLGTSCGSGQHKILPGWVLSRVAPGELHVAHVLPGNRKRWWQGLLDRVGLSHTPTA